MGVDSGLPDFRGNQGFWRAYPPFEKRGLSFVDMANPRWFWSDPGQAWGFYGHRLGLYRSTKPHSGFEILRRWGEQMPNGAFVFTSNVDGQFQLAGFDDNRVCEIHGSIHHFQCVEECSFNIWDGSDALVKVDEQTFRARHPLPTCPQCGAVARPNILMFGDGAWLPNRTDEQHSRYRRWLEGVGSDPIAIVECGAGTAIPSVRMESEHLVNRRNATLVRINPRESFGPSGTIEFPLSALKTLSAIDAAVTLQ